ncbi:hypothetical protein [Rhodococcus sp. 1168]|uniref:hypothetical protein n=1 Tax=Rhodococcus sp. 1168 TaxID=2018041 RepID=UPI000F742DAC|nr:hypothetical protein [Rhodococcus sp. 1168]
MAAFEVLVIVADAAATAASCAAVSLDPVGSTTPMTSKPDTTAPVTHGHFRLPFDAVGAGGE